MIVQDNPTGTERFVMTMDQHTAFATRLAEEFGNDKFASIENEPLRYVIANHDAGWKQVDPDVHINPASGFPYHLSETPFEYASLTMRGSPDFNAKHDALSGLLSSMHTTGLLNGRYGLAPPGIMARLEGDKKPFAESVLAGELARQNKLKAVISVDETFVWNAYKHLQFFDMLSLYFHSRAEGSRGTERFPDVPTHNGDDVTVTISEGIHRTYALDPFPFKKSGVKISFFGRWVSPVAATENGRTAFEAAVIASQTTTLLAG
ncbi:MAG: DUF3891 family protein [Rhodospirillales bacterium]|jgi:hypothetical protein